MQHPLRQSTLALVAVWVAFVCPAADSQTSSFAESADRQERHASDRDPVASEVVIPGPLRSFLRMAGISQKASPEEVLPLLARNVFVQGYVGWERSSRSTEFLVLLSRYVGQARELAAIGGADGAIRVANCQEAQPLLHILGYRFQGECGQHNASLVTADAERAFLTTDSGFPLPTLEEALLEGKPFSYPFPATRVPVLFTESDWKMLVKADRREMYGLLDLLLRNPALARLYWAMSRIDPETRVALQQSVGLKRLLPVAPDLDFYGTQLSIRSGRVQVPGGTAADAEWKDLVGASPESPAEFIPRLLAKDKGWLASFFDSLARTSHEQQQHFAEAHRLKIFYAAFRGSGSTDAARPVFRQAPGLLLLVTRLQWDADGQPLIPGGVELWKEILNQKNDAKVSHEWAAKSRGWSHPDEVVAAMFAFARVDTDHSPLQMYLLLSDVDSRRSPERALKVDTLRLLAKRFEHYNNQFLIFSEFSDLDDASITNFVNTADAIDKLSNHVLRGNAMGIFQANIGLWQILASQQQIPTTKLNDSWRGVLQPFGKISTSSQLFDAGRDSLAALMQAAGKPNASQQQTIELLAGPRQADPECQRIHEEVAKAIRSVMDGQRLVPLDTLLALGKGLNEVARGSAAGTSLFSMAGELREFEMPRPIFTSSERSEWAAGIYNNRHTEMQMQTDLTKVLKSHPSPAQLEEARGQLAPFLRDTLVGLNYAYYEPPGSQLLRMNPLLVRSHDFAGDTVVGVEELWHASQLYGQGTPAGGGAHLVGSLSDLPYVLSEAEQDFITPENIQALIWRESVPSILTSAIVPRWWNVSRKELHAIALYQIAGEELLTASASNDELRAKVMSILSDRMLPQKAAAIEQALRGGGPDEAIRHVTPADVFFLTTEFRRRFADDNTAWGPSGQELDRLHRRYPEELSWERLSRDFGVPHRILAPSEAREMMNVKPFPAFSGYSSRLMAESWDSNNLYWARLADEKNYPPAMLNVLVPELTRRMVEKIFATDFEDWQALLRALHETGEEFRNGKIAVLPSASAAVGQPAIQ